MAERIKPSIQHPKQGLQEYIIEKAARKFIPEITVEGLDNLRQIATLAEQNNVIVFMSNHQSFADPVVLHQSLKRSGFEEIARRLVFMAGETQANLGTRFLSGAYPTIDVLLPSVATTTEKERKKRVRIHFDMLGYAKRSLEDHHHLVIYPEAGREKHLQGHPDVADLLKILKRRLGKEIMIAPIGVTGTEIVLPPGKIIPVRHNCSINFGSPFALSTISNQPKEQAIQTIMYKIAECLPNRSPILKTA